jgi:hypothetical protein
MRGCRPHGVLRLLGLALLLTCWLTGCVAVPNKGPVEKIEGQQVACQNCVNVEVSPPAPGDQPLQIVEGYLRATSNYQPNYSVAKQFLTETAASKWSPEDGAAIYTGSPAASGKTVTLDGVLIGSLGSDRTYTARDAKLHLDFGLVKEKGEWRISTPPRGLMVEEYSFTAFYQPYNLYFLGNGGVLVPDRIYLPSLRTQSSITSVLMKALLAGPSAWLAPAVTSALPANTTLSVDSVTVADGTAEVPLSDAVLQLNDTQRGLMAAQVVYTLKQVTGVKGAVFLVNSQPVRVPGGNETDFSVTADSVPGDVQPIPFVTDEQLYVARPDGVRVWGPTDSNPNGGRPLPGPLGTWHAGVDSLAVSVTGTDLAAVTDGASTLRRTATSGGNLVTLIKGARSLLRPQFSRFGELWVLGEQNGRQRFWIFSGDKELPVIDQLVPGPPVTAFKISPDGSRIALVRQVGSRSELGLARIVRADSISVSGWRTLDTTQSTSPVVTRIEDLGWEDATDLFVLGAGAPNAMLTPFRISQDVSGISPDNEPTTWDASQLTVSLSTQTAVVVGRKGQTWRDDGGQWQPYLDRVRTAAYPG